jgi:quinol monooxygenase YgiN
MGLLVEYTLKEGQAGAQKKALEHLVSGLRSEGTKGFSYTAYATDDPRRFVAVFEFEDAAAKERFLNSAAFEVYRTSAKERFEGPPQTTTIQRVASTLD